ncbi:MAG: ABC transporter ATP-binding protein [Oscillospiraceae bacterium]|nr:ABC transporter ATP-binding protein [Oscillospiraceae bacterium]
MLEIHHLSKKYGAKEALHDVSFALPRGQIVGLFGENGAGKTTLMKCILGLTRYRGEITLDGEPIMRENMDRLSFATSEHSFFPTLNAKEHRVFYAEHFLGFNEKRFRALMDFFALPEDRPVGRCSMGQKNQFEVVLALSQGADYILMDEPFAGNDVFNREDFYKVLLGILTERETVLLSTHLLEEVQGFVGRALLLHEGVLIGDVDLGEAEDRGEDLMGIVRRAYAYRADRVQDALQALEGDEGDA